MTDASVKSQQGSPFTVSKDDLKTTDKGGVDEKKVRTPREAESEATKPSKDDPKT